jgi:creatinine amidohydrolase
MPLLPLGYLFKYAHWPGAVSVPAEVVQQSLFALCAGCANVGLKRVFVMSGHDENREAGLLGLREANRRCGVLSVYCDWLDLARNLAGSVSTSKREGHGSEIQTSVLMALRPELAIRSSAEERMPPPPLALGDDDLFAEAEAGTWVRPMRGRSSQTGDPASASAAKGALIVERIVNRSAEILQALRQVGAADA